MNQSLLVSVLEGVFEESFQNFTEERFFSQEEMDDLKIHFYKSFWSKLKIKSIKDSIVELEIFK